MPPSGLQRQLVPALLAVSGGVAWGLCFGREPLELLPWVALAPLVVLLGTRRPFAWGFAYGFVSWLVAIPWIGPTLEVYGGMPATLSWLLLLLMCAILGLDHAVFAWLGSGVWRRGGWTPLWALPSLWLGIEFLRGFYVHGFPWNLAAYTWIDVPGALAVSSWIGAWGVSWMVMAANVAVALAVVRRRWRAGAVGLLGLVLVLVLAGRFAVPASAEPRAGGDARILQPDSDITWDEEQMRRNYRRLIDMSLQECREGDDVLLLWPESAAFPHTYGNSPYLRRDLARLARAGCRVLVGGAGPSGDGGVLNQVLLVGPGGPEADYAKRRLVPWGEYVPLGEVLPFVGKLARNAGNFTPGRSVGLLPWHGERLAPAICYEVVFPGPVAEQVRAGASVLVTVTNDAWYGDTAAPWQHLRAARFRAAENRRPLLRAALTGVSAVVDARGRVVAQLGVGERGVLRTRVAGGDDLAPFTRAPWAPVAVAVLLAAFAIVRGLTGPSRRARGD